MFGSAKALTPLMFCLRGISNVLAVSPASHDEGPLASSKIGERGRI